MLQCSSIPKLLSDAATQDLSFLGIFIDDGTGVEGPNDVFCEVNTKELDALDYLHGGAIIVQWGPPSFSGELKNS